MEVMDGWFQLDLSVTRKCSFLKAISDDKTDHFITNQNADWIAEDFERFAARRTC